MLFFPLNHKSLNLGLSSGDGPWHPGSSGSHAHNSQIVRGIGRLWKSLKNLKLIEYNPEISCVPKKMSPCCWNRLKHGDIFGTHCNSFSTYPIFVDGCDKMIFQMDLRLDIHICHYHSFEFWKLKISMSHVESPGWQLWRICLVLPPVPDHLSATLLIWDHLHWPYTPNEPPWPDELTSLHHPPSWILEVLGRKKRVNEME